jgi:hypothetical protein
MDGFQDTSFVDPPHTDMRVRGVRLDQMSVTWAAAFRVSGGKGVVVVGEGRGGLWPMGGRGVCSALWWGQRRRNT